MLVLLAHLPLLVWLLLVLLASLVVPLASRAGLPMRASFLSKHPDSMVQQISVGRVG